MFVIFSQWTASKILPYKIWMFVIFSQWTNCLQSSNNEPNGSNEAMETKNPPHRISAAGLLGPDLFSDTFIKFDTNELWFNIYCDKTSFIVQYHILQTSNNFIMNYLFLLLLQVPIARTWGGICVAFFSWGNGCEVQL